MTLDKRLPIAAGLGGGSSDAGAALKLARQALALDIDDAALEAVAAQIGADGPMCVRMRTAWAEGRGDVLTDEPRLPPLPAVLFNPGVPSPTGAVYRAYDAGPPRAADRPAPPVDWSPVAVIDWLAGLRNDLQPPAEALTPAIADAVRAVGATPGVALARMSGSGRHRLRPVPVQRGRGGRRSRSVGRPSHGLGRRDPARRRLSHKSPARVEARGAGPYGPPSFFQPLPSPI